MVESSPPEMTEHEIRAWNEIQKWKRGEIRRRQRTPEPVRRALTAAKDRAVDAWGKVPGNDEISAAMTTAMEGGFRFVNDAVAASLDRDRLLRKFSKANPTPHELADLRRLNLRVIDKKMPNLAMRYSMGAAGEGIGAGFVMGAGAAAG